MAKILYLIMIVVSLTILWYAIFAGIGLLVMVTTGYALHVSSFVPLFIGLAGGIMYLIFTGRNTDD
jgi:hypothetical protein